MPKLLIVLSLLCLCVTPVRANLVCNGGFEDLPLTNPPHCWTITNNGNIDVVNGLWLGCDGSAVTVDLNGSVTQNPAALSQTLTTVHGTSYCLRFCFAGNPHAGPPIKTMTVTVVDGNGTTLLSNPYAFDITGHDYPHMGWVE